MDTCACQYTYDPHLSLVSNAPRIKISTHTLTGLIGYKRQGIDVANVSE